MKCRGLFKKFTAYSVIQATSVDATSQIYPLEIKGSLDTFKINLQYLLRL